MVAPEINSLLLIPLQMMLKEAMSGPAKAALGKIQMMKVFSPSILDLCFHDHVATFIDADLEDDGIISAAKLKKHLGKGKRLKEAKKVKVLGHFFAGTLLTPGWWERQKSDLLQIDWKDNSLQNWLFSGFEQWAPSWDISEERSTKSIKLMAQIGTSDEADSIPVIIKSEKIVNRIRGDMGNELVMEAVVTGMLCLAENLQSSLGPKCYALISKLLGSKRHVIIVDDEHQCSVERKSKSPVAYYSGYPWQCVAPREVVQPGVALAMDIEKSYFLWEHTNFADRDVIQFNLDSLSRKRAFVGDRLRRLTWDGQDLSGDLVLLQRLMSETKLRGEPVEEEQPAIKVGEFYQMFDEALREYT
ncbi:MAG: hypothetical protein NVS2B11_14860 [Acetobacteraceae bacterium]